MLNKMASITRKATRGFAVKLRAKQNVANRNTLPYTNPKVANQFIGVLVAIVWPASNTASLNPSCPTPKKGERPNARSA